MIRALLHYEIIEQIGAGGMGEVYRARDTKLGREVAIKMLPPGFARHPERIARLRREAQVLATLNHPNIAAIYDLGEVDGIYFLVLELVPGKTLSERLQSGAFPLREALPIGRQIAEALEAAHDKGILHRDLKPANIKITPEGRVKLLDFGLAKAAAAGESSSGDSQTRSEFTEPGKVLGTAAYMSPEQARGKPLDKRSDIWSFGCVMYEVLSGQRLFTGQSSADIIAAILRDDPKLDGLPPETPAGVRLLLERCLRHDVTRRLRDIGDARIEMDEALTSGALGGPGGGSLGVGGALGSAGGGSLGVGALGGVGGGVAGDGSASEFDGASIAAARRRRNRQAIAAIAVLSVALAAATAAAVFLYLRGPSIAVKREVQFQAITDRVGMEESPAISPDGKTVAFVARAGSGTAAHRQVWIHLLSGGTPLQITHDDADHEAPRWAPDSSTLLYFSPSPTAGQLGTIWEISALGGTPRRVAAAMNGGDISHDGKRIAAFQLQEQGKQTELITFGRDGSSIEHVKLLPDDSAYDRPRWSPDDRSIAFHSNNGLFDEGLYVTAATATPNGNIRQVAHSLSLPGFAWLPDGSGFLYSSSQGSTVLYPPIANLRAIQRDGGNDRQITFGDVSYVDPDVHPSGKLVAARVRTQSDIWKFPVGGPPADNTRAGVRVTHQTAQVQTPSVSPRGDELVYLSDSGGHGNLWVAKTDGSGVRQLTFERDPATGIGVPVWSPAGNLIAMIVTRQGETGEAVVNPDGGGFRKLVSRGVGAYWSADGHWLYYSGSVNSISGLTEKIPAEGGQAVVARAENGRVAGTFGSDFYFARRLKGLNGGWDWELGKANPENGPFQVLSARIDSQRIPVSPNFMQFVLSPDGKSLVTSLVDAGTTNLWLLPSTGGAMKPISDFGQRTVVIARRVAWSPDSKFIYAAVAETDADVVLIDGLLR